MIALHHLRRRIRRLVEAAIGVAVHVDESGERTLPAASMITFAGLRGEAVANRRDGVAAHSHVRTACGGASAIDEAVHF